MYLKRQTPVSRLEHFVTWPRQWWPRNTGRQWGRDSLTNWGLGRGGWGRGETSCAERPPLGRSGALGQDSFPVSLLPIQAQACVQIQGILYLFYYCGLSWPDNEQNQNTQTIYGFNASVCNFKHRNPVSAEPLSLIFTHTLMDVRGFTRALGLFGGKLLHP